VTRKKRLPTPSERAYDVPFVAINHVRSVVGGRALLVAVLEVGDGFLCIEWQLGISQVVLCAVKKSLFEAQFFSKTQDDLSDVVADFKSKAYTHGATLEAIQLLKELTELTTEEEDEMAKTPAAKAAAATKLSKASEPKAAKAEGGKAGRAPAEFDYKVVKGAKNDTREGTWTHHMAETILAHTSTAEARAANAKAKGATPKGQPFSEKAMDFAWAKEKGLITY